MTDVLWGMDFGVRMALGAEYLPVRDLSVLLDLTLGRKPHYTSRAGEFSCCASFVMRTFEGKKLPRKFVLIEV